MHTHFVGFVMSQLNYGKIGAQVPDEIKIRLPSANTCKGAMRRSPACRGISEIILKGSKRLL